MMLSSLKWNFARWFPAVVFLALQSLSLVAFAALNVLVNDITSKWVILLGCAVAFGVFWVAREGFAIYRLGGPRIGGSRWAYTKALVLNKKSKGVITNVGVPLLFIVLFVGLVVDIIFGVHVAGYVTSVIVVTLAVFYLLTRLTALDQAANYDNRHPASEFWAVEGTYVYMKVESPIVDSTIGFEPVLAIIERVEKVLDGRIVGKLGKHSLRFQFVCSDSAAALKVSNEAAAAVREYDPGAVVRVGFCEGPLVGSDYEEDGAYYWGKSVPSAEYADIAL